MRTPEGVRWYRVQLCDLLCPVRHHSSAVLQGKQNFSCSIQELVLSLCVWLVGLCWEEAACFSIGAFIGTFLLLLDSLTKTAEGIHWTGVHRQPVLFTVIGCFYNKTTQYPWIHYRLSLVFWWLFWAFLSKTISSSRCQILIVISTFFQYPSTPETWPQFWSITFSASFRGKKRLHFHGLTLYYTTNIISKRNQTLSNKNMLVFVKLVEGIFSCFHIYLNCNPVCNYILDKQSSSHLDITELCFLRENSKKDYKRPLKIIVKTWIWSDGSDIVHFSGGELKKYD